jgi:hypothetical protein
MVGRRRPSWCTRHSDRTRGRYVNAFLLVDLTALAYCFGVLGRNRDDVRTLFQSVGDLDAALAVASLVADASQVTEELERQREPL